MDALRRGERQGEVVHEEAEAVARRVVTRNEVVHAFGRAEERGALWVTGVGGAELVEDGVRVDGGPAGGVEDVCVDDAAVWAFVERFVGAPEAGEVVAEIRFWNGF